MTSGEVSRETPPPPPAHATDLIPADRLPLASAYVERLAGDGIVRGLIGPREVPRLWDRHVLNCAAVAEVVPAGASVCDLGSGAGLPGLVLAIARPDLTVTLVEPLLRRTTFLQEVVDELALGDQVRVVRGRAEEQPRSIKYDVVTSRALAPMDRLLGWSMPLVSSSGALLAMKGSSAADEIEAVRPLLRALGCTDPEILEVGVGVLDQTTRVVRVTWARRSG